jgi:hypothetical protein
LPADFPIRNEKRSSSKTDSCTGQKLRFVIKGKASEKGKIKVN